MTCHFFEPNRADTEPVVRCACDLGPERWVCEETSLDEVLASRGAKPNALIQLREGITRYIVFPMEYVWVQQGEIPARILHSKKGRLTERLTRFRKAAHAPVRQSIVEPLVPIVVGRQAVRKWIDTVSPGQSLYQNSSRAPASGANRT